MTLENRAGQIKNPGEVTRLQESGLFKDAQIMLADLAKEHEQSFWKADNERQKMKHVVGALYGYAGMGASDEVIRLGTAALDVLPINQLTARSRDRIFSFMLTAHQHLEQELQLVNGHKELT